MVIYLLDTNGQRAQLGRSRNKSSFPDHKSLQTCRLQFLQRWEIKGLSIHQQQQGCWLLEGQLGCWKVQWYITHSPLIRLSILRERVKAIRYQFSSAFGCLNYIKHVWHFPGPKKMQIYPTLPDWAALNMRLRGPLGSIPTASSCSMDISSRDLSLTASLARSWTYPGDLVEGIPMEVSQMVMQSSEEKAKKKKQQQVWKYVKRS